MASTLFSSGTVVASTWLNDVDKKTYDTLSAVTGTNTITATGPVSATSYTTGLRFFFNPQNTNTGASTLNVSGLGAKSITKYGSNALVAGDLVAGAEAFVYYDGTQFQLVNPRNADVSTATGVLPIANGGTGATTANTAFSALSSGVTLSSRNKIINGLGTINQRSYVSGTNTTGANQYTLDRWRVVTSGQNLTFSVSGIVTTMTAPAGGLEQVIEGGSIEGGVYTLSWTGTATATVNGSAITSGGQTASLTAGSNVTVRFTNGTVSLPQFEKATVATPFEYRHPAIELMLCQRFYYRVVTPASLAAPIGAGVYYAATQAIVSHQLPVPMRAVPSVSFVNAGNWTALTGGGNINLGSATANAASTEMIEINFAAAASATSGFGVHGRFGTAGNAIIADAEL